MLSYCLIWSFHFIRGQQRPTFGTYLTPIRGSRGAAMFISDPTSRPQLTGSRMSIRSKKSHLVSVPPSWPLLINSKGANHSTQLSDLRLAPYIGSSSVGEDHGTGAQESSSWAWFLPGSTFIVWGSEVEMREGESSKIWKGAERLSSSISGSPVSFIVALWLGEGGEEGCWVAKKGYNDLIQSICPLLP